MDFNVERYRTQIDMLMKRRKKARKAFGLVMLLFWSGLLAMAYIFRNDGFFPSGWIMVGILVIFSLTSGIESIKRTSGMPENPRVVSVLKKKEVIRNSSKRRTKNYYFYAMVDGVEKKFPCELSDYYQMEVGTQVLLVDFKTPAGVSTDSILVDGDYEE